MRILFISVTLILSVTALNAQGLLPSFEINPGYRGQILSNNEVNNNIFQKKWSISRYSGISTSFVFYKGGNAAIVSAPVGVQLNRRLNNNLIAFGRASVAPSYVNFHQSFMSPDFNKANLQNGVFRSGSLGMYTRAELGLQYVNDERTFSISGSIGIERSTYVMPFYRSLTNNPTISTSR